MSGCRHGEIPSLARLCCVTGENPNPREVRVLSVPQTDLPSSQFLLDLFFGCSGSLIRVELYLSCYLSHSLLVWALGHAEGPALYALYALIHLIFPMSLLDTGENLRAVCSEEAIFPSKVLPIPLPGSPACDSRCHPL